MKPLTYKDCGVDYAGGLDAFKVLCQRRAEKTDNNASRFGVRPLSGTRGESVMVLRSVGSRNFGVVEEGLGTKNLVADAMQPITGRSYYDWIAQDTLAMIVNDMATLGVQPVTTCMHLAVGSNDWFENESRAVDLIEGWGATCDLARCIWAGGETPVLRDIIYPGASLLSGSSYGIQEYATCDIDPSRIQDGDIIVGLTSSGIHANGLTLARRIADNLPRGYETELPNGMSYGEALLQPTHIYSSFVEDCLKNEIDIHYAVNVTGHGFRKVMRAVRSFAYVIDWLPERPQIFDFIMEHGPVTKEEAYGNLNMGIGFVLIMHKSAWAELQRFVDTFPSYVGFTAHKIGNVERSNRKFVEIKPENIEFDGGELNIR